MLKVCFKVSFKITKNIISSPSWICLRRTSATSTSCSVTGSCRPPPCLELWDPRPPTHCPHAQKRSSMGFRKGESPWRSWSGSWGGWWNQFWTRADQWNETLSQTLMGWQMAKDVSPSTFYFCRFNPGLIYEELFRFRRLIGSSVSYFERQRLEMSKKSIKFLKTLRQVFLQTVWGLEWACSWGNLGFAPWVSNSTFCIYELFISV